MPDTSKAQTQCSADWDFEVIEDLKAIGLYYWICKCGTQSSYQSISRLGTREMMHQRMFNSWMEHIHPDYDWEGEDHLAELLDWLYPEPARAKVDWRRVWELSVPGAIWNSLKSANIESVAIVLIMVGWLVIMVLVLTGVL
jgi:hypothetical protein